MLSPASTLSGVSAREEIEFTVGDFDTAKKFLQALGYEVTVIYEKYRTTYERDNLHITFDEMPYGQFVEIEGLGVEVIKVVASKLGLNWKARINENYLTVFKRAQKALNLDFQDLTFENFKGVEIGLDALGITAADADY